MAKIKVSSTLQNSVVFNLHELIKDDKGLLVAKSRDYRKDRDGNIVATHEIPPLKSIVIKGRNKQAKEMRGFETPYALTEMDSKDWEHLQAEYAYTYEIKTGLIFAEKNEGETIARSLDDDQQAKKTGTDPLKVEDLTFNAKAPQVL